MTNLPEERRVIMRIHAVWQTFARAGIPTRSQIDPKVFGADWAHCLFVELESGTPKLRFSSSSSSGVDPGLPRFDGNCISERLADTLLTLAVKHIPRVLQTRSPLGHGGTASHAGKDILYRIVLLPLSEDGDRINALLAAMTYRDVSAKVELRLSDIAWCNRMRPEG